MFGALGARSGRCVLLLDVMPRSRLRLDSLGLLIAPRHAGSRCRAHCRSPRSLVARGAQWQPCAPQERPICHPPLRDRSRIRTRRRMTAGNVGDGVLLPVKTVWWVITTPYLGGEEERRGRGCLLTTGKRCTAGGLFVRCGGRRVALLVIHAPSLRLRPTLLLVRPRGCRVRSLLRWVGRPGRLKLQNRRCGCGKIAAEASEGIGLSLKMTSGYGRVVWGSSRWVEGLWG